MDVQLTALDDKRAKELEELEADLDFKQRSDELKDRKFIERMLNVWKWALTTSSTAELLGLTPLQYVATYGNDRLNAFVAAWRGNSSQAARDAGYTTEGVGPLLYRMPIVRAAIRERERNGIAGHIYNAEQLKAFWTGVVRSEDFEIKERLKAADALGKAHGLFVQKIEATVNDPAARIRRAEERLASGKRG